MARRIGRTIVFPRSTVARSRTLLAALALAVTTIAVGAAPATQARAVGHIAGAAHSTLARAAAAQSWGLAGRDLADSRSNGFETILNTTTVAELKPKWVQLFPNFVAATPAVVDGRVYLADKGGHMGSFDAGTGNVVWSREVSSYTGIANDVGKATPAVANGRLIFGDQPDGVHDGASIIAADTTNGSLIWRTVVDTTSTAMITGAPVVDGNTVYVGVSSRDEQSAACCTFRGSVVALNATTGAIVWRTYTVPAGYTGDAVWGGSPVVDHLSGLLYVGTGNNYSVPAGVCTEPAQTGCTPPPPDDYSDSLVAMQLSTGHVVWALHTLDADVWTHACSGATTCGPDWDFGSAPNEFTTTIGGVSRRLVGIGQKSGVYWAVDAYTGALVWNTKVGPAPIMWGSATDNTRIYVAIDNRNHKPYTLLNGTVISGGAWSALDTATGKIIWQRPDPEQVGDFGFVSTAHGIVFAGSGSAEGNNMYAIRASTGQILWQFAGGGSMMGGAAVVNGWVYWASGYGTRYCPSGATTCGTGYRLWAFATK